MKHLRLFESFNKKDIHEICRRYNISDYTINSDGSIDVDGNVDLRNKDLTKLPLKFNHVEGFFCCRINRLSSLMGAPQYVRSYFDCDYNHLTSLEGAPEIANTFTCDYNRLITLMGAPQEVDNFYCSSNKLTSLVGAPRKINGIFDCQYNKIWTFEGAPDYISGFFYCDGNPIYNIWKLFEDYSKIELFNYYDIIREVDGKPAIILDRLNDFLEEIGENPVEKVNGYINI